MVLNGVVVVEEGGVEEEVEAPVRGEEGVVEVSEKLLKYI